MQLRRTALMRLVCPGLAAMILAAGAIAQDYPNRPVTVLVGFSAGSATDTAARAISQKLSERLKVPVIIDNKPGAGTLIAVNALRRSAADGYTLMLASGSTLAQIPGVQKDLSYSPLTDFTPVAPVLKMLGILAANPSFPANSLRELVDYARTNPGKISYGSSGIGSTNHLAMELLIARTDTQMVHIPYKGDNQVSSEMVAGRLDASFQTIAISMPFIKAGKLKALAVTSSTPVSLAPGLPTLSQGGVPGLEDLDPYSFAALVGPVGLDQNVVRKLNDAVNDVLKAPDLIARLGDFGFVAMPGSPEGLTRFMANELAKWKEIGRKVVLDPSK